SVTQLLALHSHSARPGGTNVPLRGSPQQTPPRQSPSAEGRHLGYIGMLVTILIILVVLALVGGGGGYYGHRRYGGRGLGGALGLVIVILLGVWVIGGFHTGAYVAP